MTNLQLLKTLVRIAQIAEEVEEVNPDAADEIDSFSEDVTNVLPEKLVNDTTPESDVINPAMFPPIETPEAPARAPEIPEMNEEQITQLPEMNEEQITQLEDQITNEIINLPEFGDLAPIFDTQEGQEAVQNLITRKIEEALGNA